jgi:hypothetical protein
MSIAKYTIEKHPHGYIVLGPVPIDDFKAITGLVSKKGVLHPGVANYYDATMALGEKGEMDLWADEIEESIKLFKPPELRFVSGTKCGRSSNTIVMALTADSASKVKLEYRHCGGFIASHPSDAGDFARCMVLLELRPDWVPRMNDVGEKYPDTKWPALAAAWPELMQLHAAKKHKELSDRIAELTK